VLEYFRNHVFSEIFALTLDNGCQDIDTWYVPCHEVPDGSGCGKPDTVVIDADKREDDDETIKPPYSYSISYVPASTNCSDL